MDIDLARWETPVRPLFEIAKELAVHLRKTQRAGAAISSQSLCP